MKLLQICSSVFLSIGLCALGYADEHFPFLAQVSKESVNIRAGANTNFEKIDKLNLGTDIVVLGKTFDWYKIQLPTTAKAYIRSDYLKIAPNFVAELIGDNVNIRAAASSDSASLGVLKKGDRIKVLSQTKDWCQIEPPAQAVGWIRQDFLTVKSSTVEPSLLQRKINLDAPVKKLLETVDIKGRLTALAQPKADVNYELTVDGNIVYYIKNTADISRLKGAIVLIKGVVVPGSKDQYGYPVLELISISLLL